MHAECDIIVVPILSVCLFSAGIVSKLMDMSYLFDSLVRGIILVFVPYHLYKNPRESRQEGEWTGSGEI